MSLQGKIYIYSTKTNNGYDYDLGTSFAAPQVAGVAALMLSVNPTLTPSQIQSKLRSTCTKLSGYTYTNGWNTYVGYGLLNAYAAVCSALSAGDIVGPNFICSYGQYHIENLPSGVTVSWSLSNNYYNNGFNLIPSYPTTGHCRIVRNPNHDLENATLTAEIKYNGVTVKTLTKTGIYAYEGFRGHYVSGNISSDIDYTYILHVTPNYNTIITSHNFLGATVSYSSSGTTPLYWGFSPSSGEIDVTMPSNNNNIPIVLNIDDVCGNQYTLYLFPTSYNSMNVSYGDSSLTVSLNEDGDNSETMRSNEPWTMEIRNAMTGELLTTQNSSIRSTTISTAGWPKGMYVVRVTIGNEVLTDKVVIK